ncbi:MAG: hypothetical protein IKS96_01345 [Fibrobacter sp.]|nr:hypothetical protein [Fibrobacter sp.]
MNKKVHNILGKLFLSSASFFWVSCDSGASAEPKPFIDIDQELAKIKQPDTTGLRGQCISAQSYCDEIENFNAYYDHVDMANSIARRKIDTLLNANKISKAKYECYNNKLEIENMPDYGVSSCYELNYPINYSFDENDSLFAEYVARRQNFYKEYVEQYNLTECDTSAHKVLIDNQYINVILENDQYERETIRAKLEKLNEKMDGCASVD